jgi:16S rRNA (guanine(966)-N(2))-methyltransferase RsmD
MMRIITGSARGVKLDTLEGEATRPTTERVKEALFSMLQFELEGREVLDLFAGSGQLGLEALSRGAAGAVFVDESRKAADIVLSNAKKTRLSDRCRITAMDYKSYLRGKLSRRFDIVFLDPPYASGFLADSLRVLSHGGLTNSGALIACECDTSVAVTKKVHGKKLTAEELAERTHEAILTDVFGGSQELMDKYEVRNTSVYGRTRISVLTLKEEQDG